MKFIDFNRLQLELEDIQEELRCLPVPTPNCRIGDFGCGSGYSTLSLMLHLHAIDCRGVDKNNFWDLPTIEEARQQFNNGQDAPAGSSIEKAKQLLAEERWPRFQLGDVLDAENLPKNLDLGYCKLLLRNIHNEAYGNPPKAEDGLFRAINKIVNCIRQGGFFCLVETDILTMDLNLKSILTRSDLKFLRVCQLERGTIEPEGRKSRVDSVWVFHYRKL